MVKGAFEQLVNLVRQRFALVHNRFEVMKNEQGLTLIELLAVVVILGIIATFAIPSVSGAIVRSKLNTTLTTEGTIQQALERYEFDHNAYPDTLTKLTEQTDATGALYQSGTSTTGPYGPYLTSVFPQSDGWGNPVYYAPLNSNHDGTTGTLVGYVLLSGDGSALSSTKPPSSPITYTSWYTGASTDITTFVYASGGVDASGTAIEYTPTVGQLPGYQSTATQSTGLAGDIYESNSTNPLPTSYKYYSTAPSFRDN